MLWNKNIKTRIGDDIFELKMGNHIISRTKSYIYLGPLVNKKCSWTNHIDELCFKFSQMAGVIFKIRTLLTKEALMLVYHALVGSKLRYGLICWATAAQSLLDKVNVAHNKIITYMTFSTRCSRTCPLFQTLKVLPLDIMIQIEHAKTMYKFENKMLPQDFDNYFRKPSHQYGTRFASTQNNFAVKFMNLPKFHRSFYSCSIQRILFRDLHSISSFRELHSVSSANFCFSSKITQYCLSVLFSKNKTKHNNQILEMLMMQAGF